MSAHKDLQGRDEHDRRREGTTGSADADLAQRAQRERLIAIGTMAAGVAHEIGNSLASVSGIVELLKRRIDLPENRVHLQALEQQVRRIANIVRQVVEFARPASGETVPTDLDDLTEQMVTMIRYSHRSRHARIESVRNRDLPPVRTSPLAFQQVVVNLLLNALDAVRGLGGEQVITVERCITGDWVNVMVIHRGAGMPAARARQVFDPFYTTKGPGEGTGLGLTLCRTIVEQYGGRINLETSPGQGTVAMVSFRAAPRSTEAPGPSNAGQEVS